MTTYDCQYYARCENDTSAFTIHPTLGIVPTCFRCAKKHDLERWTLDAETVELGEDFQAYLAASTLDGRLTFGEWLGDPLECDQELAITALGEELFRLTARP